MMSDDREAIARLSRVYRAGAAVRVGSLTYTSQCFPALSVAGIRQFSPVSTCQGEGRGFESRRPLSSRAFGEKLARCSHNRLLFMQVVMLYLRFKAPFQSVETT
jgi:hypothetical protein